MRWLSLLILVISLTSCTALKPVINNKKENQPPQHSNQPAFIENITYTPSLAGANMHPTYDANTSDYNTFNAQGYLPGNFNALQFKYSILMDEPVEALNNLKLFSFIDDWYGTPYRFGGNERDGIDCSAFTSALMTSVFGIGLPRMAKDQFKACERIKRKDLAEGDLVFFHTTRKGISHVGIYLGNNKFVHASLNYGVTISDMADGYYSHAFRGGGRARQDSAVSVN